MILQALKEYYDRKMADPESDIAPEGWIRKGIDFVIVLKENGDFLQIDCLQEKKGKKTIPFQCIVPSIGKQAMKHTMAGNDANLLWDNSSFVLGLGKNGETKSKSFISTIDAWFPNSLDPGIIAVNNFLEKSIGNLGFIDSILKDKEYEEKIRSGKPVITFKIAGDSSQFVFERPTIKQQISANIPSSKGNYKEGICLVTGDKISIVDCHMVIKGVWGAQTSGATIVGFNKLSFCSFGKTQGFNAPVGKTAVNAYTTALNNMLTNESSQRIQVGDASTVFWSEKNTSLEKQFIEFFGEPPKDDPNRGTRAVESLFNSIKNGAVSVDDSNNKFFVLGLAPNASRISIRFWIVDTVLGMSNKICQHFEDLRMAHGPKDQDFLSLFRLLVSIATQGKSDNIPPSIAGETIRAILQGLTYPETLLQAAVRRNRAEHVVTYSRAALIKACINRKTRYKNPKIKEELKMSLDPTNTNIGYRLGRLFAALEKIQQEANPGLNATIRDKFYGAASGTPVTVFGNLMRLKNHHLAKLESTGRRINLERLLSEIMDGVQAKSGFPAHLSLDDQGRFAIGYYHQMQDFYTKKTDKV